MSREWTKRSACLDEDPELFFPVGNSIAAREQEDAAKDVCRRCDVRAECLEFAMTSGACGVFGGFTETDRDQMKRARSRHGTPIPSTHEDIVRWETAQAAARSKPPGDRAAATEPLRQLVEQGIGRAEIARILGLAESTVQRRWRALQAHAKAEAT